MQQSMPGLGQILPNLRQQLTRAEGLRNVIIAARRPAQRESRLVGARVRLTLPTTVWFMSVMLRISDPRHRATPVAINYPGIKREHSQVTQWRASSHR
jgi:hypothetical protein